MRLLAGLLRKAIRTGTLTLRGPDGFGETFGGAAPGPDVAIRVSDPAFGRRIAMNPELAAAEAFMAGVLTIESPTEDGQGAWELLELFFLNKREFDLDARQIARKAALRSARRFLQHNPVARSRANVRHHYDIGNDLYRLFLDRDLQYSCAYFPDGGETLEEAQTLKKRRIAAKLALAPGQRVLDIGCGWGGMALYLAGVAGVEVTGVTLSEAQLKVARARAEAAGLADRCRFELTDYREVTETYDRVVSVGMLEHVGIGQLGRYFLEVRDRLKPDGVALIHSISSKAPPGITSPFLARYIFPGGYAPSLSEVMLRIERSGLWLLDCEVWRVHYARTLRAWRQRFEAHRAEVEAMHDARFARMWEFYLAACEGAFAYGSSNVVQLQLGRTRDAVPLSRGYVAEAEARLAGAEAGVVERLLASSEAALGA